MDHRGFDLRHDVQVAPFVQLKMHRRARFQPCPKLALGSPDPFGDGPNLPPIAGVEHDDPIGLTQFVGPQDNAVVAVETHNALLTETAKATIATLILGNGVGQMLSSEIRPERFQENKFGVRRLPNEKVGDPILTRGSDP